MKEKFTSLVDGILDKQGIKAVFRLCENTESVEDCGEILRSVNKYGRF